MRKIILLLILIIMLAISAHAEWTEPLRITHIPHNVLNPRGVMVGDTVHAVCRTGTDIYYLRSNDNGETWTEPVIPLPDTINHSQSPDIAYSDGYLHIVLKYGGLLHIASTDGGRNWGEPHLITNLGLKFLRLIANGDTLFTSYYDGGDIVFSRSFDRGINWDDPVRVETSATFIGQSPSLNYSQGIVHLFSATGIAPAAIEVYHMMSIDKGITWSMRQMLSEDDGRHGQEPAAAADTNGNFLCTWFDYKYGSACIGVEGDILGRVGHNHGDILEPESRLTYTQTGRGSSCLILNEVLHVIWNDYYQSNCSYLKILYSQSTDWGATWTEPIIISGAEERTEKAPFLYYNINRNDTTFHCLMDAENPDDDLSDIYYFKGTPDITGIEEEEILPSDYILIEAYPNPFNSNTTLTLNNPRGGDIEVVIYNLYGQEIKRFQAHGGKEVKIGWDATDAMGNTLTSGIYFARARTSHQSQIIKLIHLK